MHAKAVIRTNDAKDVFNTNNFDKKHLEAVMLYIEKNNKNYQKKFLLKVFLQS